MSYSDWLRDPRREAAAVLQGTRPAGAKNPTLDSALIEEVAKALSLIRGALPDLAGAISDANPSALRIALRPAAGRRVRRLGQFLPNRTVWGLWRLPIRKDGTITGIRIVDSLSHRYGVVGATLWSIDAETQPDPGYELTLGFGHYVNVKELVPKFSHIAEVEAAFGPDPELGGTYVRTHIEPRDLAAGTWRFLFNVGRGDCPAGCTWFVKTTVGYDRTTHQTAPISRDTIGHPQ